MRISGRQSQDHLAAAAIIPVDARIGRPVPPDDLTDRERHHFERLALARRPGWYSGAEVLLSAYCTALVALEDAQAQLRKIKAGTSNRRKTAERQFRMTVELVAKLGVKLRLTPSSKTNKFASREADDRPMEDMGHRLPATSPDADAYCDENGERSFERLRQLTLGRSAADPVAPQSGPGGPGADSQSFAELSAAEPEPSGGAQ